MSFKCQPKQNWCSTLPNAFVFASLMLSWNWIPICLSFQFPRIYISLQCIFNFTRLNFNSTNDTFSLRSTFFSDGKIFKQTKFEQFRKLGQRGSLSDEQMKRNSLILLFSGCCYHDWTLSNTLDNENIAKGWSQTKILIWCV